MAPATQAKMLRVLQDGRFERLGGSDTIQADVRVIAATNRDLDAMIADGRFREDLYYRLKVFTIALPPLRDRRDDIPILVERFVKRFNRELGKQVRSVSPEAMACSRPTTGPATCGSSRRRSSTPWSMPRAISSPSIASPRSSAPDRPGRPPGSGRPRRSTSSGSSAT